jgi:hypothetical protein
MVLVKANGFSFAFFNQKKLFYMKLASVNLTKCTNPNSPEILYQYAHSCWRVNATRIQRITHILAIHKGMVREVYKVTRWNQISSSTEIPEKDRGRWAFDGHPESNIGVRQKYIGRKISTCRYPVRYY